VYTPGFQLHLTPFGVQDLAGSTSKHLFLASWFENLGSVSIDAGRAKKWRKRREKKEERRKKESKRLRDKIINLGLLLWGFGLRTYGPKDLHEMFGFLDEMLDLSGGAVDRF
jgi:hypothetical protein